MVRQARHDRGRHARRRRRATACASTSSRRRRSTWERCPCSTGDFTAGGRRQRVFVHRAGPARPLAAERRGRARASPACPPSPLVDGGDAVRSREQDKREAGEPRHSQQDADGELRRRIRRRRRRRCRRVVLADRRHAQAPPRARRARTTTCRSIFAGARQRQVRGRDRRDADRRTRRARRRATRPTRPATTALSDTNVSSACYQATLNFLPLVGVDVFYSVVVPARKRLSATLTPTGTWHPATLDQHGAAARRARSPVVAASAATTSTNPQTVAWTNVATTDRTVYLIVDSGQDSGRVLARDVVHGRARGARERHLRGRDRARPHQRFGDSRTGPPRAPATTSTRARRPGRRPARTRPRTTTAPTSCTRRSCRRASG